MSEPICKVCVLSVFNFCVCLPCVVTCLFPCLVFVLPCSRHVLSYVCLSMPCALLLLSVSPPLTCSQSPALFVVLVSPVSCYSPCLFHLCLCLPRLDCSHLSLVICCLCVYIVLVFLFLVVSS